MRSVLAGLRRLVIPWGATVNQPRVVIGDEIPPELLAFYVQFSADFTVVMAIIAWRNSTDYHWSALVESPTYFGGFSAWVEGTTFNGDVHELGTQYIGPAFEAENDIVGDIIRLYAAAPGTGIVTDTTVEVTGDLDVSGDLDVAGAFQSGALVAVGNSVVIGDLDVTGNLDVSGTIGTTGTYTPQLQASTTNPTLGTGAVQAGRWYRQGGTRDVHARIRFGTAGTAAGSGTYRFTLPTAVSADLTASGTLGAGDIIGHGIIRDDSAATTGSRQVVAQLASLNGGPGGVGYVTMYVSDGTSGSVTNAVPFAWTTQDGIAMQFRYPEA